MLCGLLQSRSGFSGFEQEILVHQIEMPAEADDAHLFCKSAGLKIRFLSALVPGGGRGSYGGINPPAPEITASLSSGSGGAYDGAA